MCVKFEGKIFKDRRHWPVLVPALDIYTQGKSGKDALAMIKEAVELSVDKKGFAVEASRMPDNRFVLRSKKFEDDKYLVALMLKNQRAN